MTLIPAGPLLLSALVVGLIVSIFSALATINEQDLLSFIPKLIATFLALILLTVDAADCDVDGFHPSPAGNIPQMIG